MRGSSFHETIVTSILLLDSHFSVKTQSQNNSPGVPPQAQLQLCTLSNPVVMDHTLNVYHTINWQL